MYFHTPESLINQLNPNTNPVDVLKLEDVSLFACIKLFTASSGRCWASILARSGRTMYDIDSFDLPNAEVVKAQTLSRCFFIAIENLSVGYLESNCGPLTVGQLQSVSRPSCFSS